MTDRALSTDDPSTGSISIPVAGDAEPDHSRRNRLVISLMLVAAFVVFLNETIIGNAIPDLMRELDITASTAQWLSTAFMLTVAIVIPITGFLMTRLTTRTVFILAMSLFSAGTALAAIAPGFEILLVGRIVQASGTAIMMPLLMTTVMTLVPPHERGKTMGNISIVMSVAPAAGPAISGVILSVADWRGIFIVVLPIALGALALGARLVRNVSEPRRVPVDVLSIVLSAFAFGGLIYGLSSLGEAARGVTFIAPWIPIAVGAVALGAFIWRQIALEKADKALLDLRTFLSRGFTVAIIIMSIMMAALFGTVILLPIYTQNVLGLSVLNSGLMLVPGSLLMGFAGPIVGRLYDRVGPRPLIVPGAIWVSVVLWTMAMVLSATTPVWVVLLLHIALSVGLALMFTPLFTSALGSLRPQLYSHGSATIGTVQQLAGAAGTALFIALLTVGSVAGEAAGASEVDALASGIHTAFLAGAIISLFAIAAALFVPKPAPELAGAGMHGGH